MRLPGCSRTWFLICTYQRGCPAACPFHNIAPSLAQASAGSSLYDTAGMDRGSGGGGEANGAAAVLEATQLCNTRQLRDMLACLGGIGVLLPFIAQVKAAPAALNGMLATSSGGPPQVGDMLIFLLMHTGRL